ncbi:zinc ribbon domain-containing protein [Vibrio vulnificus]|uniref:zinc ribbon domain-containing protein n=1 Tax=Vibrio vulnificus TaxID=672 RepID=UPI004059F983
MSIIFCPECSKEISDKAPSCIHCGLPMAQYNSGIKQLSVDNIDGKLKSKSSVENVVRQGVDVVFGLLYIYLGYSILFTDELRFDSDIESAGIVFGLLIAFAVLCVVQKLIKTILGTIAKVFDNVIKQ